MIQRYSPGKQEPKCSLCDECQNDAQEKPIPPNAEFNPEAIVQSNYFLSADMQYDGNGYDESPEHKILNSRLGIKGFSSPFVECGNECEDENNYEYASEFKGGEPKVPLDLIPQIKIAVHTLNLVRFAI